MITRNRIGLVLAATLVGSLLVFLLVTYNVSRTQASTTLLKSKVPRRHDRTKEKPNASEVEFLRKHAQEEKAEERVLEDEIPKHVPLRVKIRKEKEKEFKDVKNENWAHDFELEVTNVGDKPIYEFYLALDTDAKLTEQLRVVASLSYGRTELGTVGAMPMPEDIPIAPGESTIVKIHPGYLNAWDDIRKKEKHPLPKLVRVIFQGLNFGDGTGLYGSGGVALPRKPGQTPQGCLPQKNKNGPILADNAPGFNQGSQAISS